jgi:ABC-type dipeptide/oligopeptide/nickel transport system ATPase component
VSNDGIKPSPLLRIEDLAVSFDNAGGPRIQAVDGANLAIYPRQTVAVVGESGCGKSVTALSLLGLVPSPPSRVDRGKIAFSSGKGDVDLLNVSASQLRDIRGGDIAMIFQEPMTSLNPVYSIGEQILEAIRLHRDVSGAEAHAIAVGALKEVGIEDAEHRMKAYPHQFSGGMRQRAMIAMALSCRPKLLLADEPTTALDVTVQKQILDLIGSLKDELNMAVMLITHDLGVVAEYADVVCVMYAGRVVEYARTADLYKKPLHPYTRGLLACIPTLDRSQSTEEQLVTVADVVDDESQWTGFASRVGHEEMRDLRPWWPWHSPPSDVVASGGGTPSYELTEVEPGHWVGLWRTGSVADQRQPLTARQVDLDSCRSIAGV